MVEEKKLDSLLERIYQDGVEKSNKKNKELLENAQKEAEKIIETAKKEASSILSDAERKASELKKNTQNEVRMAGEQAISEIKQRIKNIVVSDVLEDGMKASFADDKFLKSLVLDIVKNWSNISAEDSITVLFPADKKDAIDSAFSASIKKSVKNAKIDFEKSMSKGFKIVPESGSYQMQFSDEDFVELFKDYLKQKTQEVLFGNK